MHRALQITEILTMILRATDELYNRPAAAAMAATCRTFTELANDIVWDTLPSPGPLLRCLPDEIATRSRTLEECARFLQHAARVKTLRLHGEDSDDIEEHIETLLSIRSCGTTTLFPNLLHIFVESGFVSDDDHTEPSGPFDALYLHLFLGPKLRVAGIEIWGLESVQLLHQLATFCPHLQRLDVNRFPERVGLVRCFRALEEFSCSAGMVDAAVFDEMAYLPSLRNLCVAVPDNFSRVKSLWLRDRFAALKTLRLCYPTEARHAAKFLRSVDSTQLHTLSLDLYECQTDIVLKALDAASKFTALQSLRVHTHEEEFHLSFPPQAILKLRHLEKLDFTFRGMSTTNRSAVVLGRACPKLRHLTVKHAEDHCWSLDVLESFAAHLPSLEYLNTEFGTTVAPTLDAPEVSSQTPICLKLDSSELSEEHWRSTAAYISRVYPNATFKSDRWWMEAKADEELVGQHQNELHWRYVGRAVAKARSDAT